MQSAVNASSGKSEKVIPHRVRRANAPTRSADGKPTGTIARRGGVGPIMPRAQLDGRWLIAPDEHTDLLHADEVPAYVYDAHAA